METHFVYAGDYYWKFDYEERLKSFILKGMQKYEIKKIMVTIIDMWRDYLITKEARDNYCKGNDNHCNESVNDDLESFFDDLRLGKEPRGYVKTYFMPKLTKKELELVETKDFSFMNTFWDVDADVDEDAMKASESDSKFVNAFGERRTFIIENS